MSAQGCSGVGGGRVGDCLADADVPMVGRPCRAVAKSLASGHSVLVGVADELF